MEPIPAVLLVDDEADHRLLLLSALRETMRQARYHEVADLPGALEALSTQHFDAVVCDYWLPGATGLDLLRTVRDRHPDLPFLLVTNHGSEEVARQAFVQGVSDYLTKDEAFRNPAALGRRLSRALDSRRYVRENRRVEALLHSFIEHNPQAVMIFGGDGTLVRWNRSLEALLGTGTDSKKFLGSYSPFLDPQLRAAEVTDALERALSGDRATIDPFPWDPEQAGLTGPLRILQGLAFPIVIGPSETPHVCAMLRDVTAEETARRERDEYAAVLASLLNATPAAAIFVDTNRKVRFANRYVEKTFGLGPERYVGQNCSAFEQDLARLTVDPEAFLARLACLASTPEIQDEDLIAVNTPERHHLRRHGRPVWGAGGTLLGRLDLYVDETETTEKRQLLEEQNRELDAFASRLAHDFKTPLVSLKGFADLLDRQHAEHLGTQGRMFLDKVRGSASILSEMVDGLRELARAGEARRDSAPIDPLPVLRLTCDNLAERARERGVELRLPENMPAVLCERAGLFQILQNLVSNAINYADTDKSSPWVEVSSDSTDDTVLIRVRDNGLGLEPGELREVFQPFRRGRAADRSPGMGLGLAITQRLVQSSQGSLTVESTPGSGTVFTVTLPRHLGEEGTSGVH